MKTWMRRGAILVVVSILLISSVLAFGKSARADIPSEQGWWTSASPGGVGGVAAPASPPAPPDVPQNGLLVQGGPTSTSGAADTGPFAYAALVYQLPGGATPGSLTLTVAPSSATTPSTTLELCALRTQQFQAEQGGPMSDAPAFDCTKNVTAAPSSSSYQFNVASLISNDALAVAILPTSPADRVVLAQPGDQSLAVQQAPTTTIFSSGSGDSSGISGSLATPAGGTSGSPGSSAGALPSDTGSAVNAVPSTPISPSSGVGLSPSIAQPVRSAPTPVAVTAPNFAQIASNGSGVVTRPWVGVIFLVALLAAAGLWMGAGRARAAHQPEQAGGPSGTSPA